MFDIKYQSPVASQKDSVTVSRKLVALMSLLANVRFYSYIYCWLVAFIAIPVTIGIRSSVNIIVSCRCENRLQSVYPGL